MFEKYNKVQQAVLETTLRIIIEKRAAGDVDGADRQGIGRVYRKYLSLFFK
ncbi:hypothetical protein [Paenibacillus sp. AR247]|uniref:hypothetical protein n=1 Tax=Paenibacillus sp. AR247 TaxID=1631599 RepID=UPI002158658C|nr:hypothetical protein [Paenibacillus sp. AR247]